MIKELAELNIKISYSDISGKVQGEIALDEDDWTRIIEALDINGYQIIKEE